MDKPLVSIVMPVYNVEKYLKESLDSVLNQDYHNFELICVDDGSTDQSLAIIQEYSRKDRRIQILQQKNQYAGIARNKGLQKARGKYIMFLDSDDIFEKNMLSVLVSKAQKYNTDIVFFGFYHFKTNIKHRSMMGIPFSSRTVCSPEEHKKDLFHIAQGVPWNKFYKRDFVVSTNLLFQGLQSNNDVFFSKAIVPEAKRLLFLKKRFVNYRISNVGSLQGTYKIQSGNFAKCIEAIYNELIKRKHYETYRESFESFVIESYMLIFDKCRTRDVFLSAAEIMMNSLKRMDISKDSYAIKGTDFSSIFTSLLDCRYDDCLFELNRYRSTYYTRKSSIEYRIGAKILSAFRIKSYD